MRCNNSQLKYRYQNNIYDRTNSFCINNINNIDISENNLFL